MYQVLEPRYTIRENDKENITAKDVEMCLVDARERYPHEDEIVIHIEDGYVGYSVVKVPINRIRRITGYLVGTTERWNDAKQKELQERVKHIK